MDDDDEDENSLFYYILLWVFVVPRASAVERYSAGQLGLPLYHSGVVSRTSGVGAVVDALWSLSASVLTLRLMTASRC